MSKNNNYYKEQEFMLTVALIAAAVLFVIFLIAAGCGVIWLKVATAILVVLASGMSLVLLYISGEWMKRRSLWLTVGFVAVVLCLLVSLVLKFPSPNPYKGYIPPSTTSSATND